MSESLRKHGLRFIMLAFDSSRLIQEGTLICYFYLFAEIKRNH